MASPKDRQLSCASLGACIYISLTWPTVPMFDLAALPIELVAHQISGCLASKDRWRLRCSSKKARQMLLQWMPTLPVEREMFFFLLTTMVFKNVDGVIENDSPFALRLMEVVHERTFLDCTSAFRRWVKANRVGLDPGGFFSPFLGTQRVRIGMWETGVVWTRKAHLLRAGPPRRRVIEKAELVPGFTVY